MYCTCFEDLFSYIIVNKIWGFNKISRGLSTQKLLPPPYRLNSTVTVILARHVALFYCFSYCLNIYRLEHLKVQFEYLWNPCSL